MIAIWLRLLAAGWFVLLTSSFVAGWTRESWWRGAKLDLRMVSCLLLAVAAWMAWWALRRRSAGRAMLLVAAGMTLGFYGDSHVGDRFWWPPFPDKILGGIVFYGIGHLAYVAASVLIGRLERMAGGFAWWAPIFLWQAIALVAWAAVALSSDEKPELRIPTLLYTLLVAATPGFATALAAQRPVYGWMALGGAMFLTSDILLAWQVFHEPFAFIDELTWINYGGGQMLIVYGAIAGLWRWYAPAATRKESAAGV